MSAEAVLRRVCLRAYRLAQRRVKSNNERHPKPSPVAILRDELSLCAVEAMSRTRDREEINALAALMSAGDKDQMNAEIEGETFR